MSQKKLLSLIAYLFSYSVQLDFIASKYYLEIDRIYN